MGPRLYAAAGTDLTALGAPRSRPPAGCGQPPVDLDRTLVWVGDGRRVAYLDAGLSPDPPRLDVGFDGAASHGGDNREHDLRRAAWLRPTVTPSTSGDWVIGPAPRHNGARCGSILTRITRR